jgi:hypothetical protein
MGLCVLARIVLVLAIISLVFHVCSFGLTIGFLVDALFMALFVFLTNLYCDSWIAKGIVILAIIGTLAYAFMCSTTRKMYQQNTEETKRTQ